jgi:serine/threonine protein phosphatase 1
MIDALRKLFRTEPDRPPPAIAPGERVYAFGDIHGRRDLFEVLIQAVEADDAARGAADTTIVLLGDLVDRGPDSAGVLKSARRLAERRKLRILCGNHEEMFLRSFAEIEVLRGFLRHGGRETVLSYPVEVRDWNAATLEEAQALMRRAVPAVDIAFMESFEDHVALGDYLFVHAGIEPGVPVEQQSPDKLRWIREPFLSHRGDHGHVVVHGHSIEDEPVLRRNRIGIDTGAYASGRLTALGLEGAERWFIQTSDEAGTLSAGP